jgi:hypothetical protein
VGVASGGSRRARRIGGGEGGELELRLGCGTERSEAPASSPNRRARRKSKEGNGGRGGQLGRATRWREIERKRGAGVGPEWLWGARSEAAACTHGGGRLANRGGRCGAGDAT